MKIKALVIATGKEVELKSYGFGYIDFKGNFYHRTEVKFLENVK